MIGQTTSRMLANRAMIAKTVLLSSSRTLPMNLRPLTISKFDTQSLATFAATPDHVSSSSSTTSVPSISNIEAAWKEMSAHEQEAVFHHLEGLQKKDWTQLSLDEKKASYWVSFGPHGPREPINPPGSNMKLLIGITACLSAAAGLFALIRSASPDLPRTMNKEWQEAATERAKEQKMDPFTGASAPEGKTKTFVQSK